MAARSPRKGTDILRMPETKSLHAVARPIYNRRVVISGYGMITPLGKNTEETFRNASKGNSGIDYISAFDVNGLPCQIGGQVKDAWVEDAGALTNRRYDKFCSRGLKLMIVATSEAVLQAKLDQVSNRERIGVSLGSFGSYPAIEDILSLHRFYDGNGNWDLESLVKEGVYDYLNFFRRRPDIASCALSILFGCKGPNLSITSACAAGAQAIGEAFKTIQEGRCDIMIAGGCDALAYISFIGFVSINALAERYSAPQTASRPFDRKRNGFVLSEGAAAVILEELEHAKRRDAPIYGEALGYGSSADAYRITDTDPEGEGAKLAIRGALADASISPRDIEYINAHGTSTVKNDLAETRAIKEVFGHGARELPISSNKSMLGHAIAAAGPTELILTLVGMNRSIILPTINCEFPDPKCDLWYVPNETIEKSHKIALSNSFGFGGQNACLCIGKFPRK